MKFRVWLKSRCADRVLAPVREQLASLIGSDSTVLEIGCGTGDLLFRLASDIKHGYGIDLDEAMISFAEEKRTRGKFNNLRFENVNALHLEPKHVDFATSTLCLHEMDHDVALRVLDFMITNAKTVLVADYSSASTFFAKAGIEFDEMLSGHYSKFRSYRKNGEISYYANKLDVDIVQQYKTNIDGIAIWQLSQKAMQ